MKLALTHPPLGYPYLQEISGYLVVIIILVKKYNGGFIEMGFDFFAS
jgi:hypothetical protein